MSLSVSRVPRRPGLDIRTIGAAVLAACAIAATSVAALAGAEALGERVARWSSGARSGADRDGSASPGLEDARLVGRWIDGQGKRLIVTAKGEVWSDQGSMEGWARPSHPAGVNFAFGDGRFLCGYAVTFTGENTTDWRLVAGSAGTSCPSGRFERPFSFSG